MNLNEQLRNLAARARGEDIPTPAVAHQVLALLRSNPAGPVYALERPLMWMAGLSSAVAVSVAVVAVLLYFGMTGDPLSEVVETVSWATQ